MRIETEMTRLLGCRLPIIAGPMFLVSTPELVSAVSGAGGVGAMPSLNWRTTELFDAAVQSVAAGPFAINLIVNASNTRMQADLDVCVRRRVPLVITSLGNPKKVIDAMHAVGSKVFCDVTTLAYAEKVLGLGADGVIAVSQGAGGHAGPVSPLVLIPYLRRNLPKVPIIAAGGIATGQQMAAMLLLGASGVQIGTRFIASTEAEVNQAYKDAILRAEPEDIVMTTRISGTPAAVIKTPFIEQQGLDLSFIEKKLLAHPRTKKIAKMVRMMLGSRLLEQASTKPTWKTVWSAGQGVGLIDSILPCSEIIEQIMREYESSAMIAIQKE